LKTKIKEWEDWLLGDDINSIRNQIYKMMWDSAVFLSINECRRYAPKNEKGEIELNGVVHQFIDNCFFDTQAIAIRRLLDKETKSSDRSVISLYRLIHDMQENCDLLTRENVLAVHNYPYDYEQEKKLSKTGFHIVPRKIGLSEVMHESIDSLAGVKSSQRSPNDRVKPQIFEWLKRRLSHCEGIRTFVNKFLAHSAISKDREHLNQQESDVTLGQILEAHKIICQTTIFIGGWMGILSEGRSLGDVLLVPQYDQFVHFDKAWASVNTVKKLHEFWSDYDMQTRSWHNWYWKDEFNKFLHE
jgi:hypothetical protein